ncbi:MAG: hypothetical protein VB084_16050 [Syntrophomonadaceae bacterium]|nr:hypothetical protein [Syntrophomonadaceae bacterium]
MYGEIEKCDIELLNAFSNLSGAAQRDFRDYMRYLLTKQYKRELMAAIFGNGLLHSLIQSLLHITEREEFQITLIENRMKQISELYFGIFEKIHCKYMALVDGLDSCELVKDFGRGSIDNINRACMSGNRMLIRMEVNEFYEGYYKFARKKEARNIVAV